MLSTVNSPPRRTALIDLAAILARGYLRLSADAHKLGAFRVRKPQIRLDLPAKESPPVHRENRP